MRRGDRVDVSGRYGDGAFQLAATLLCPPGARSIDQDPPLGTTGSRDREEVAAVLPLDGRALDESGYLIGGRDANKKPPLPLQAELQWWYQFYFATERGRIGYEAHRRDFAKLIWRLASPKWQFDDATFERSAASFDNPDHVSIVVHNYRWRLGLAEGEPAYDSPRESACGRSGDQREGQ